MARACTSLSLFFLCPSRPSLPVSECTTDRCRLIRSSRRRPESAGTAFQSSIRTYIYIYRHDEQTNSRAEVSTFAGESRSSRGHISPRKWANPPPSTIIQASGTRKTRNKAAIASASLASFVLLLVFRPSPVSLYSSRSLDSTRRDPIRPVSARLCPPPTTLLSVSAVSARWIIVLHRSFLPGLQASFRRPRYRSTRRVFRS